MATRSPWRAAVAALALVSAGCAISDVPPAATSSASPDAPSADPLSWTMVRRLVDPVLQPPAGDLRAECARRRVALAQALSGPGLVFLRGRSGVEDGRFFQSDDFYYLTGVEIPDVALLMQIGGDGELLDEVLFLPAHDPVHELWDGPRLSPGPDAEVATGIAHTAELPGPNDDGSDPWTSVLARRHQGGPLWLLPGDDVTPPPGVEVMQDGRRVPGALRRTLDGLRLVKSEYELHCLRNAIEITGAALLCAFAEIAPGKMEYTAQGAIEGAYLRLGAERPGFDSICASGIRGTILHYDSNRAPLRDGDLMVMDVGAKYRYYCADITRTVPVNGRFTPRQREVYEIVLAAQTAAADAARPGMTLRDVHAVAYGVLEEAGYAQYFPHSTSHWLGLDVHDVGGRDGVLVPGSAFTIEPGIYLPDEGFGIRIEDDYLMTADGALRLSTMVPSDPDAIEALFAGLQ